MPGGRYGNRFVWLALIVSQFQRSYQSVAHARDALNKDTAAAQPTGPTLVSYSYFEKNAVQRENMEFFVTVGMGRSAGFRRPERTDFVVTVSGDFCSPCEPLLPALTEVQPAAEHFPDVKAAWSAPGLALLQRTRNEGMDFAAHNITLRWVQHARTYSRYRYFIFLNSSVRGPFVPSYMPPDWQWTRAYTDRLVGNIKLVTSSIVCLPHRDLGGFGPKAESWAWATDQVGLDILIEATIFHFRRCKVCADGIIVHSEYGLTNEMFSHGYNIATLMSMYSPDTNWTDRSTWHCNNNTHPSRHGSYDGISMHPFEVVFLKASWHVGEPHTSVYSRWFTSRGKGNDNTAGTFDEYRYLLAASPNSQGANNASACFKIVEGDVLEGL